MTVPSQVNKSGPYFENGVTTVFEYKFKIDDETHIMVVRSAGGIETVLELGIDYTVTGVGDPTGDVVMNAAGDGSQLMLLRKAPFTQELELENQGPYFAKDVERALDLAVMRDQELSEQISRSVKVPVSADPTDLETLVGGILALTPIRNDIQTVAGISGQVVTVAGLSTEVATVAGIAAHVVTVAGIAADVSAVAGALPDIGTVAANVGDVSAVAGISGAVQTVAGNMAAVNAVSADIADVSLAAANMPAILAAPGHAQDAKDEADRAESEANRAEAAADNLDVANLRWLSQPLGVPIPFFTHLPGVELPPTNNPDFRFIKLTAGDVYNDTVLTNESVSGSAPLVVATADISDALSPMDGETIHLINTERRVLRAGMSGVVQEDAMQRITGEIVSLGHARPLNNATTPDLAGAFLLGDIGGDRPTSSSSGNGRTLLFDSGSSPGARVSDDETRVKNIGIDYFMRIR